MVATSRVRFPDGLAREIQPDGNTTLEVFAEEGLERLKDYARDEPIKFALWALGIGFVLGWKLKPW